MTKKIFTFILLLSGMFSTQFLNAQNCSGNKVWACRYDECGIQECKCINANQVASWTATVPKCSWKWHPNCCDGFRIDQNESGMGINTSLQVSPNPVSPDQSGSATISFSLEQSQNVSLRIYDVNGRLVSIARRRSTPVSRPRPRSTSSGTTRPPERWSSAPSARPSPMSAVTPRRSICGWRWSSGTAGSRGSSRMTASGST